MLELRADDGSKTPNAYRPVTQPGVYVPTAVTIGWESITMRPFAMTSPSQFRPGPPSDLKSEQWAKDYNEIKELGEKNSTNRTARQTEDARFWLTTGPLSTHALERQIVVSKSMSVLDSARFMAMVSVAEADTRSRLCTRRNITINSGVRSQQFEMATLTAIRKQSGCRHGSRLTSRRHTQSIRVRTASLAQQWLQSSKR